FDGISVTGGIAGVATHCGNLALSALDAPILGGPLRLRAGRNAPASQAFLLGLPTAPLPLCAAGCLLGVNPVLVTFPGSELDLQIPPDPKLLGGKFAVQNVQVGGSGGCALPTFPVALIVSDTLVATMQ